MANACNNCGFQEQRTPAVEPTSDGAPQWRDLQRARLAKTRTKIQDCRVFLERLEAEREELEDILESFVFPVIGIPIEIITLIFRHSLPAHGRVKPSKHAAPLVLAQICRHWREIALSIPQLW
ncbi:hypothetical protein FB451DRAFT_1061639, partial [Mycena latifolia]